MTDLAERKIVTFSLGRRMFGIDMSTLVEIREWERPAPLPKVAPYIMGVANLRGTVIPIVDLSDRLGWGDTAIHGRSCILVVVVAGKQAGFLVDEVADIISIDGSQVQPAPEMETSEAGVIAGLLQVPTRGEEDGSQMISLLDLETLGLTRPFELAA